MRLMFLMILFLIAPITQVAAIPTDGCEPTDIQCIIEDADPLKIACIGALPVNSDSPIARQVGAELYYHDGDSHWVGVIVADGRSGTGEMGGYNSFVFFGGTTDHTACELFSADTGKMYQFWAGWAVQYALEEASKAPSNIPEVICERICGLP